MTSFPRFYRAGAVIVVALALVACGGDDDSETSAGEDDGTTTTTEATDTTLGAAESEAAINEATTEFFRLTGQGDFESAVALMENGQDYIDELEHCADLVEGASVEMKTVEIDGDSAITTFAILLDGEEALAEAGGGATFVDGEWLVSENTFLSLYDAAKDSCTGPPPADA
jgi:hypothetical protein